MTPALWTRLSVFFRSLLHRNRLEAEMEDELRFHIAARTADLTAQGVPPREAARQAHIDFGSTGLHQRRHALRLWHSLAR